MSAQFGGGKFHLCIQTMISYSCASVLFMHCHTTARLTILDAENSLQITGYLSSKFKPEIKLFYWRFSLWSKVFVFITTGSIRMENDHLLQLPWPWNWNESNAILFYHVIFFFFLPLTHCCFTHLQRSACKITLHLKFSEKDMTQSFSEETCAGTVMLWRHSCYCTKHTC